MVRFAVPRPWLVVFAAVALFVAFALLHPLRAHAATITVTTTADETVATDASASLREAITSINNQADTGADVTANRVGAYGVNDTITFNIPGAGVHMISGGSALPTIAKPMTIDGYSQLGAATNTLANGDNAVILIQLDGTGAGSTDGLTINANACTIRGLNITRFVGSGIVLNGGNTIIAGNFIGTNPTGTAPLANGNGIAIQFGATNNTVGGTAAGARNVISGNTGGSGVGIQSSGTTGNTVEGNYIGTDAAGTAALANAIGVNILGGATNNTVGGTTAGARNIVSGNTAGVAIQQTGTTGNIVEGNYIGTDVTGTTALANGNGIVIHSGATNNTVGGTAAGARNVISGNSEGALIQNSGTTGNLVEGNYIGTNVAGTAAIANGNGIAIQFGATNNTVGGTAAGAGNVISGNIGIGVGIGNSGTTGNTVEGNYIGTDAAGTAAIANGNGIAIQFGATNNTVGGTAAGARNVISGNTNSGVGIQSSGTTGNLVEGNYIGTDAAGTAALANAFGVNILGGATNNTVGGTAAGAGNVISGNTSSGVLIQSSGTSGNVVEGNLVGTNVAGTAAIANGNGVNIAGAASGNTVGGTAAGAGNVIAFNTVTGVTIGTNAADSTAVNNAVLGNPIHDNGVATGIDLASDGVTPNGANPRAFPNDGQNFPLLTAAFGTTVTGTLDSVPSAFFRIEFFASSSGAPGGRNGQTFLGFLTSTTDGSGHSAFIFTAPGALPTGSVITATATNTTTGPQLNDTSEFAAPLTIASGIAATAGTPQSALINHPFGTALAAKVTDSTGAGLANIPVTFTAPASGASGAFTTGPGCTVAGGGASATCLTNAGGVATAPAYTANGTTGSDGVVASVAGVTPTATFALTNLPLITLGPATLPGGVVGAAYSQTLTASGGSGTGYTFSVASGTLPPGLALSASGTLSGTPTTAGMSTFMVQAQDSLGNTGNQQYTVTITAAPLVSIAVTPAGATLKVGQTQQYTATGKYADNSTADLTGQVTWTSDVPSVASITSGGMVTGVSPGTAHPTASMGSITGQTSVTVTAPTLTGVSMPPAPASRPSGTTSQPGATPPAPAPIPTGR